MWCCGSDGSDSASVDITGVWHGVQALSVADQKSSALQEKLIAVQDQFDRASLEHDRQRQDWQTRHEEQLNLINSLQSDLSHDRQQLQDNRLVSLLLQHWYY